MHHLSEFLIKYVYLDKIRWKIEIGYAIGLNMDIVWILSNGWIMKNFICEQNGLFGLNM